MNANYTYVNEATVNVIADILVEIASTESGRSQLIHSVNDSSYGTNQKNCTADTRLRFINNFIFIFNSVLSGNATDVPAI